MLVPLRVLLLSHDVCVMACDVRVMWCDVRHMYVHITQGSSTRRYYGGIIIMVLLDAAFITCIMLYRRYGHMQHTNT